MPNLLADFGGTNTRVAFARDARIAAGSIRNYRNRDFASPEALLQHYLQSQHAAECTAACIAGAGPKIDGNIALTNLNWSLQPTRIAGELQIGRVILLNDLEAVGYALNCLHADKITRIAGPAAGDAAREKPKLVIGVGTGFNACAVHPTADGLPLVAVSESGHINLPALREDDLHLADFLRARCGFAAVEEALSGRGLAAIHAYLRLCDGKKEKTKSPAKIAGYRKAEGRSARAVRVFMRMLGLVAGDLALAHLPFGGVYFCGGVVRSLMAGGAEDFVAAFVDKGGHSGLMKRFWVGLIEDDFAGLRGCAAVPRLDKGRR